ncbi:MAG: H(+)/Cl(-) exchange transporter ClcA [Desulfobacteraceae bacterium]|nr:H(+)/Cl(-) exchange transporter ClcA [Desulfobacteraceae bacterium]
MQSNKEQISAPPKVILRRRILSLKGFLIGLAAGLASVAFRLALENAEKLRNTLIGFSLSTNRAYLPALLFGVLIPAVVFVTLKYAPDASGSGIPHLKGYLGGFNSFRGWRILIVKFFGGVFGIGSGLALGREGPTVQMGAAVAKICGDRIAPNRVERKVLISAGAGAGLAAAFNAPMAGVFFVLEELHSSFNQTVLVTAFVASVTADIVCRLIMGDLPVFHVKVSSYPGVAAFPLLLMLGFFLGFLGLLFNKVLLRSSGYVQKMKLSGKILLALGIGISLGAIGLVLPDSLGMGTGLTSGVLANKVPYSLLALYFCLRFVLTMISYSTGAPGGIFAPMLLLGALAGMLFGHTFFPDAAFDPAVWGILGMVGYFSAVVRAPITGIILILEMTSSYELLLPLMIVSLAAYSIPEYYKDEPVYEALLNQGLRRKAAA